MADPYVTLGIARDADGAAVKRAYRRLAKQFHPDANGNDPTAADKFAQITAAYDLLSNADKRASFDRGEIDEAGNPRYPFAQSDNPFGTAFRSGDEHNFNDDIDLSSVLDSLFGNEAVGRGGRRGGRQGADAAYLLKVKFEDAATGRPQEVVLSDGRNLKVAIPPGVESGTRIMLRGEGHQGRGVAGDAYFTVQVEPHPLFRREGDDIHLELPIRIDEAVLGAKVPVPTVDGRVMLSVPKASTSGQQLRIRGKGVRRLDGKHGNQIVRLLVDVPPHDRELEQFVAGWSGRSYDPRSKIA